MSDAAHQQRCISNIIVYRDDHVVGRVVAMMAIIVTGRNWMTSATNGSTSISRTQRTNTGSCHPPNMYLRCPVPLLRRFQMKNRLQSRHERNDITTNSMPLLSIKLCAGKQVPPGRLARALVIQEADHVGFTDTVAPGLSRAFLSSKKSSVCGRDHRCALLATAEAMSALLRQFQRHVEAHLFARHARLMQCCAAWKPLHNLSNFVEHS